MEEEQFVFPNFEETPQSCQGFQIDIFADKRSLNIPETISEQSSLSSNEDNLKINDSKVLIEHFNSDNKENIASNNSVISDESTVCSLKTFNYPNIIKCEKKLLESSNNEENSFEAEKKAIQGKNCLQFSKKLKFLNDSVSTPPSVLREQISLLRKEMNEAYEFHDYEIQILNEERKEDPENYAQLIEKYTALLELYSSLKSEYEEYRNDQEKIKYELQSKTVNCLESLCSQIETSDNSLSSASFISFNTDLKCSTMIGNFTENEATLLHDVTIQTKDPLSDTDVFKTPKMSAKKINYEKRCQELEDANSNLIAIINSKDAILKELEDFKESYENECEKLKRELIKNENIITNLSNEMDMMKEKYNEELKKTEVDLQIAITSKEIILKELEHLKLFQKDYEEIIPHLKKKEDLISTLQCQLQLMKENHDEEIQKIKCEKQEFEKLCISLEEKNDKLRSLIATKDTEIKDLETLKSLHEEDCKNVNELLKEKDRVLLNLKAEFDAVNEKYSKELKKTEDLQATMTTKETMLQELEQLKSFQKNYEEMQLQLKEKDERISNLEIELLSIKEHYGKEVEKIKSEKIESEQLCIKLEDKNASLLSLIETKDTVIKDLEVFKSSHQNEFENLKIEVIKNVETIGSMREELVAVKEKYEEEIKKTEVDLQATIEAKGTILQELEQLKSLLKDYEDIKPQMEEKENIITSLQSDLLLIKDNWKEEVEKIKYEKQELEELFMSFKDKNASLLSLIETKDSVIKDLEVFKSLHEEEWENVKLQLKEKEDIISNLKAELETMNEKFSEEMRKTEVDFQATIAAKETMLQEFEQLKSFQKNYEELKPQIIEKENIITSLQSDLLLIKDNWKEEVEKIKYEKQELEELFMSFKDENASLLSLIETKDSVIKDLEVFKSLHEEEWENVKLQLKEKEDIISNLKAELETMNEKFSEEIKKTKDLQDIIAAKEAILQELEQLKSFQKNYEELKPKMKEKDERISSLEINLLSIKTNFDEEVEKLRSKKIESEELCIKLEDKIDSLLALITAKDSKLKDLEVLIFSHENECETLKLEIIKNEEYVRNLKAELETVNEKFNEDLKKTKKDLQATIAAKESVLQELEHLKSVLKDYEEVKLQLEEKEDIISNLQTELLLTKKNFDEIIERIKGENAELKELCIKLENKNGSLLALITTKDSKIKDLEVLISSHENECETLKLEIIKNGEFISNLKVEMDRMKEKHNEEKKKMTVDLEAVIEAKETILRELECLMIAQKDYEQMKPLLKEKEEKISNLQIELLSIKEKNEKEIQNIINGKVELEKLCTSLEGKNASLLDLITSKDLVLKELEVSKSLHEKECENVKRQLIEKEEIVLNLKAEKDTIKEECREELKKTETNNVLSILQVSCEKLRSVLDSKKFSDIQNVDLLKFVSVDTETEDRVLTTFMSAVSDIRNKLLQEWEVQKINDCLLIKELKYKISKLERINAEFDSFEQKFDNLQRKNFEEEVLENELAGLEKMKLSSVKEFPKIMKQVISLVKKLQSRAAELKEENEKLDEECDSYAKVIKDLKKEAAIEWKKNKEKVQVMEGEISRLTEMKTDLEEEKKKLLRKISKLEEECQRLKANILPEGRNCGCGVDSKKVNDLKRIILVKEQRLLELQDLEVQTNSYKSQIEYLKNALDKERKKINEEREKNKKLQNDLNEATHNQKTDSKKFEENQILEELRMRGSISGGVVQEIVDKEKMRKLSKDVSVLKEICRARYAEIKRLEAENAALKNNAPKNSNQMDSPIRSRAYNTRSKSIIVEKWITEMDGKENKVV